MPPEKFDRNSWQRAYEEKKRRAAGRPIRGPRWSGLSYKQLGSNEYHKQLAQLKKTMPKKTTAIIGKEHSSSKPVKKHKTPVRGNLQTNSRTRYPHSCGVSVGGTSSRSQKYNPDIQIDRTSKTISDIEAKFAEIDRRLGGINGIIRA